MRIKSLLNYNQLISIINLLSIFSLVSPIYFNYPTSIFLKNGNIFVIHKSGITICNADFTYIIKEVAIFPESEQILNEEDINKISISQYIDGYIFSIIYNKIFIFNDIGEPQYNTSLIENRNIFISLAIDKIINTNEYYYLIGYNNNYKLNLKYYKYNSLDKNNELITYYYDLGITITIDSVYYEPDRANKGLTCQFMNNIINTDEEFIVCIDYVLFSKNYLIFNVFNINEDNVINVILFAPFKFENNVIFIKSVTSTDRSKALVGVYQESGESNFFIYKYHQDFIYYQNFNCDNNKYYGLKTQYFEETDQFSFSYINNSVEFIQLLLIKIQKMY